MGECRLLNIFRRLFLLFWVLLILVVLASKNVSALRTVQYCTLDHVSDRTLKSNAEIAWHTLFSLQQRRKLEAPQSDRFSNEMVTLGPFASAHTLTHDCLWRKYCRIRAGFCSLPFCRNARNLCCWTQKIANFRYRWWRSNVCRVWYAFVFFFYRMVGSLALCDTFMSMKRGCFCWQCSPVWLKCLVPRRKPCSSLLSSYFVPESCETCKLL